MNDKYSSTKLIAFCVGGIIFNLVLSNIVKSFDSPLYLDTGGTIFIAALGGYTPGIAVGFLTNVISSIISNMMKVFGDNPDTIVILDFTDVYFSVVSAIIAILAAFLAHRGYYSSLRKTIMTIPATVFITTFTNMTVGFLLGFTDENLFLSELETNFAPNLVLEMCDKGLMIVSAFFALKLVPSHIVKNFRSFGRRQALLPKETFLKLRKSIFQLSSLRTKIMLMFTMLIVSIAFVVALVGYMIYRDTAVKERVRIADGIMSMIVSEINPNRVDEYIKLGRAAPGYNDVERNLYRIRASNSDIKFLYVYKIEEDGCHVVFDLETSDVPAEPPGNIEPFDEGFRKYLPDLLAGRPVPPIITDDKYGNLLTIYKPVYNHNGKCVCYAAVDFSMGVIHEYGQSFAAQIITLLAGCFIFILACVISFVENNIILPINTMAWCTEKFSYKDEWSRMDNVRLIRSLEIQTGDEIEHLYTALIKSAETEMRGSFDLRKAEVKVAVMDELAHTDSLTSIKNKTAYIELTEKIDSQISAGTAKFCIVMIDVNYLKRVNDTYGHERGNEYLINACKLAGSIFGEENIFRVGGDEFVVVLTGDAVDNCKDLIRQINDEIKKFKANDELQPWEKVSAAVGAGFYREGVDKNCEEVFKRADTQMYKNKLAMKAMRTD